MNEKCVTKFLPIKDQIDTRNKGGKNFIKLLRLISDGRHENCNYRQRKTINARGRGRPELKHSTVLKILELKTVQTNAFKVLIEALKEILTDANLTFDSCSLPL